MGSFSITHWLIVAAVVLVVFGAGKLPKAMGDLARGVKSFRREMASDETRPVEDKAPADRAT